jgi:nicotinate-nucleotide--dimethylbenzimidazole phosphoribosyltransferase
VLRRALHRPAFQERLAASLALNAVGTRIGRGFLARRFVRRHRLFLAGLALKLQRIGRGFVHRRVYARLKAPTKAAEPPTHVHQPSTSTEPQLSADSAAEARSQALSSAAAALGPSDGAATKPALAAAPNAAQSAVSSAQQRTAAAQPAAPPRSSTPPVQPPAVPADPTEPLAAQLNAQPKPAPAKPVPAEAAVAATAVAAPGAVDRHEPKADVHALAAPSPSAIKSVEAHAASPAAVHEPAEETDVAPSSAITPPIDRAEASSPQETGTVAEVELPTPVLTEEEQAGPVTESAEDNAASASVAEEATEADHGAPPVSPHAEGKGRVLGIHEGASRTAHAAHDPELVPPLASAAPLDEPVPFDEAVPLRVLLPQREWQPSPPTAGMLRKVLSVRCPAARAPVSACAGNRYTKQAS